MNDNNSEEPSVVNSNLCLICQTKRGKDDQEHLSKLSSQGATRLVECAEQRKTAHDYQFSGAILRILQNIRGPACENNFVTHNNCYATFTARRNIETLQQKNNSNMDKAAKTGATPQKVTRSESLEFDKLKCIVCQQESKEHLRLVMSTNMHMKLTELSKFDYQLNIKVNAVGDLIAADAMYHSTCRVRLGRVKDAMDAATKNEDRRNMLPFWQLCKEFRVAASLEKILKLDDVWQRYVNLAKGLDVDIPVSFESRRSVFKTKLEEELGGIYQFFQPLNRDVHEIQMLLIPVPVGKKAATENSSNVDDDFDLPSHEPDDFLRTIVHCALVLLQGEEVLDSIGDVADAEDRDEAGITEAERSGLKNAALSIAQDIVYAVSKRKKLTPKHINLGLTLHHATRSKQLVNLFHAAGHIISYRNVLQADTTLATVTLQKFDKETGAVTPPNFKHMSEFGGNTVPVPHVAADNINLMLDSLDGKKVFNVTQMVAFQRKAEQTTKVLSTMTLSKSTTLQVPPELNELCSVGTFARPEPHFLHPVDVASFTTNDPLDFTKMSNHVLKSRTEDITFLVSRMEADKKVGWTEFNKKQTFVEREPSAVGFMPIILNPAHEIETLTTVLQGCIALGNSLGYKYISLTADQQLYCKLLEWSSPEFKERFILRMGGLHIAMNFLHTIGQHMAGSGLSEIWLESGILAEGSATKVLEGKAYAKAMRAHKLTLQALWRILYPQILANLEDHHFEDEEELELIFDNPEYLRDYLQSSEVLSHITDFLKQRCEEDKNFALWWSYMDMVFILLMLCEFGVAMSSQKFSQVDPDHAQEWLVGTCKDVSGGIVGITEDVRTLQRLALSLHWRSEIAANTYASYGIQRKDTFKEEGNSRRTRDISDEDALLRIMETMELLPPEVSEVVCNIATKDRGTKKSAAGCTEMKKDGRDFLHTLVVAFDAGREVDLNSILRHELCNVPISLALMNGDLRPAEKASIVKEITKNIDCPSSIAINKNSACLIIDGMAFVQALVRTLTGKYFSDIAGAFNKRIEAYSFQYNEVHVVFDRYRYLSVKADTRKHNGKGFAPVRRVIKNEGVPLPKDWSSFVALSGNKADLARFLSEEAMKYDFGSMECVPFIVNIVLIDMGPKRDTKTGNTDNSTDVEVINQKVSRMESDFTSKLAEFKKSFRKHLDSTSDSALDELWKKVEEFEKDVKTTISQFKTDINTKFRQMEATVDNHLQKSNNKSLIVHGIPENDNNGSVLVIVMELLQSKFKIHVEKRDFSDCYRLGKKSIDRKKPRPIAVQFVNKWKRDEVYFKKRMLKGSQLFVTELLTKPRLQLLQDCQRLGERAFSLNGNIFVQQDDEKQLIRSTEDLRRRT
ncbi:unnamed protein product [Phaedon cochleariae]|uniref:Uncharacterized protein n=1 Tax=Phaedon cochleariae TaxID=80249 RepID=A0A9N9SGK9_PHACE|nr:unnamed protein product [Phaedon cochleariae]